MSVVIEHVGPWTVADVLALPDDGSHARHELIDGALIMAPSPGLPHQRVAYRLRSLLDQAAMAAGTPVEVFETINVQAPAGLLIPDISVVDAVAARTGGLTVPASAVVAVVEIESPSTRRIDRFVKPGVYAEAGIPVYWRVELEPTPLLSVSALRGGVYVEVVTAGGAGAPVNVSLPFPATVDLAALAAP